MIELRKYKLEELCIIQIGKTPRREVNKYWGKGYTWVSISDMKSKVINSTKEEITETAINECGCKLIKKGSLLLSFKLSIGKLAFAGKDLFTNEAIVGLQIKDPRILLPEYLYYVLKNIPLVGSNNAAMGSTLNKESLRILKLPLPSRIEDQHYIVKLLNQAEALIAQRKESINLLDELLKNIFLEMFGEPINNKKKWPLVSVSEFSDSRLGKMLDGKKIIGNNLKPYLRNTNVQWFKFNFGELLKMDFDEKERLEFSLDKGDILMCEGGEIGRCAIWKGELKECFFQKALHRIRLNKRLALPEYFVFLFWLYANNGGLKKYMGAATISHLTGEKLKNMKLPLPPLSLQTKFAQIVERIDAQKDLYKTSLQELDNLYKSLSQKAFAGNLFSTVQDTVVSSTELEEKYFLKRKILATYIINKSLNDLQFGDVKFEKLLHLSDYFAIKRNLNQNYLQKAAGPYDNAFTIPFFKQIEASKWFTRKKAGAQYVFKPGENHEKSINTYGYFGDEELQKVNKLINYFKNSDYEQPEIISTLYAVWNNRILKQHSVTDELLKGDFLSWDTQKIKYKDRLDSALKWMRKEGLVPDGWGKVIEKPKAKRNGK